MEFRVLGPLLAIADNGREIPLGGPKQRAVLALLLTNSGRVVETDHLVDQLWPDALQEGRRKTAQAYVSRLRGLLGAHGGAELIQPRPNGYRLDPGAHRIDAREFERALTDARSLRSADPAQASRRMREALHLWLGRPFEDAFPTAELELEAARLEELRLSAVEVWAEAELAAGRHRDLIGELRRLADEYPLQEHLWALLMLALYRSGRQAEALSIYPQIARRLADELGVEPGTELSDFQRRMLNQDPGLEPPASVPAGEPSLPPRKRALRVGRPRLLAAAGVGGVLIVATMVAVLLAPTGTGRAEPRVDRRISLPEGVTQIVAAGARIWAMDPTQPRLTAVGSADGTTSQYELPATPSAIAAGLGYLWIASEESGALAKIDSSTGRTVLTVDGLDLTGAALAVGPDAVWIVREHVVSFLRVNPDDLAVEPLWFHDGFGGPAAPRLAVGDDLVWASNAHVGRILSFDPDRPGSADFAGDPRTGNHKARSLLTDRGAIWFSQPTNGTVTRIDAASRQVTAVVELGRTRGAGFGRIVAPYALAAGPGGVWVALPDDGAVVLLDGDLATVLAEIDFERPTSIAASFGDVWVLDEGTHEVVRILPATCSRLPFIGPGSDLRGCNLTDASLLGVDLTGADLRWADLTFVSAQHANLTDADLYGADLTGASLDGVTWSATRCPDGALSERHGGTCTGVRR